MPNFRKFIGGLNDGELPEAALWIIHSRGAGSTIASIYAYDGEDLEGHQVIRRYIHAEDAPRVSAYQRVQELLT